jgi:hypothetical protein
MISKIMSNGEKYLNWTHPLMKLAIINTASLFSTWHISTAKTATSLMMLLTNVFWMHKPHKSLMSQSSMMHMRHNLLYQKVSHLHPTLLDQRLFPNVNLITTNYAHSLVGLVQKSLRRLLSTPHSMLVFLLVHYLKRSINLLIQH